MSERIAPRKARSAFVLQLLKFGTVGGVGFIVNLVVFNALRATIFNPSVEHYGPLYATIVATIVAITVNWIGNRFWAFSDGRQTNTAREGVEFFAVSLVGMLIPLACVWISHYLMGFTSPLADNISNNVVGLGLGTLFRFALYRWWVFSPRRPHALRAAQDAASAAAVADAVAAATASTPTASALAAAEDPGLVGER
ncbi:GtrA family protein [Rathayibacter soli]|uniref:GtrA family protein n=1 Tax=Rathayibacter soli TaxID=3144168 RepID=UPI0027E57284|nr:GtrA family protein [Glaciibacter superstes]